MEIGSREQSVNKAVYIMIGGFLGAGKSTAMGRLARRLTDEGRSVGLITNDQGAGLVDTTNLRSQGFDVEEIPGGCFCCRFDSLVDAARSLTDKTRPEVFLAEPVGSCTDLVASVSYPLRRIYGEQFRIAPFSVLVDPIRALRVFDLGPGRKFSSKVVYIYKKQLEEANFIVINKCDGLGADDRVRLRDALSSTYPGREIFEVSARTGEGLDPWFDRITSDEMVGGEAMEVDYEVYADGEALLGWVNATARISSAEGIDSNALLEELAAGIQHRLSNSTGDASDACREIAHLKMTVMPDSGIGDIGLISLVRQDYVPELTQKLSVPLTAGQLVVNLRAEAAPELLRASVEEELAKYEAKYQELSQLEIKLEHIESFRPGKPSPTHRMNTSP